MTRLEDTSSVASSRLAARYSVLLNVGMAGSLAIMLALGGLIVNNYRAAAQARQWTGRTHRVIEELESLFSALKDAETGQRGYLLVGKESYLEPYEAALTEVERHLASLRDLTRDSPAQQARVETLGSLTQKKLAELKETIDLRRTNGLPAALAVVTSDKGKLIMDQMRREVAAAQTVEWDLLQKRSVLEQAKAASMVRAVSAGGATCLGLLVTVFFLLKRENAIRLGMAGKMIKRQAEAEALQKGRAELERRVEERTADLRQSEQRLTSMLEGVRDYAIIFLDLDGRIAAWNTGAEQIKGYRAEEIVGKHFSKFYLPEDVAAGRPEHELRTALAKGRFEEEHWRVRKDGSRFWASMVLTALRDAHGQINGFVKITRDLTTRKQAEEALRASNQELEHFAYVASHDLQEPLRAVSSFSQLLASRYQGRLGTDADEFIAFIVDGAKRMQTLINDLLAYSRVGTRGKPFAPVAIETALQAARANLEVAIAESGAVITHDSLPTVRADSTQLAQLFQNLLGNAIKFRQPETAPRIHIAARPLASQGWGESGGQADPPPAILAAAPGWWQISVRDNGIGIDPHYFERIFIIFQRLHDRDRYPGTGIGLAICKKIVERHGGRVWVESEPGAGSTFHFTLPEAKIGA